MDTETARVLVISRLSESAELRRHLIESEVDSIVLAGEAIRDAFDQGGKVLIFGNGGSAADAQHIAAEFVGRFIEERSPLPALALTTDSSAVTAIGNDYGFEQIFARQINALGNSRDVAIAISTSGHSANVLAAVDVARQLGLRTIGLTGRDGGKLGEAVDIPIVVPSQSTARIQECHITIGHILCEIAEDRSGLEESSIHGPDMMMDSQMPLHQRKLATWDNLLALRSDWRSEGKVVVSTNGCFDLLHAGHVWSMESARRLGDVLVVGINGDESVRQLKGPGRPIVPVAQRVAVLAALECVDHIFIFDDATPERALNHLKPDIHCKGGDYGETGGKPIPETKIVESHGGRVRILPLSNSLSTSELVRRILEQRTTLLDRAGDGEG